MKIRVPATSANLGPGFDSCGIALCKYLEIEIIKPANQWYIDHEFGTNIATDETNLLIQTALKIAPNLEPFEIKMRSEIPLARGLGSSSSVIVAGIELANQLANLDLTNQDKLQIATAIEGHPDNVAPAIFGDFVISTRVNKKDRSEVYAVTQKFPNCQIIAYIPNEELLTKESRQVLPHSLPFKEAVQASAIANVMVAALLSDNLELAGKLMSEDRFHEPYREKLVPHLKKVKQLAQESAAYGVFLSGAGPTILILIENQLALHLVEQLNHYSGDAAKVILTQVDRQGIQVEF